MRKCAFVADHTIVFIAVLATFATSVAATANAETMAFTGATIMPVSGPAIENGTLLIRDDKILAVGAAGSVRIPSGAKTVDLTGAVIVPGLVDSHSHIGEVAGADESAPIQPEARVLDSVNIRDCHTDGSPAFQCAEHV